jgi:AraC-like DNA-binding protein
MIDLIKILTYLIIMSYFNDITFINSGVTPDCISSIKKQYEHKYSLQLNQSGKSLFGINHRKPLILEGPVVYYFLTENIYHYGSCDEHGFHQKFINFCGTRANRIMREGFQEIAPEGYLRLTNPDKFVPVFDDLVLLVSNWKSQNQAPAVVLLEKLLSLLIESSAESLNTDRLSKKIKDLALTIRNAPFENWDFKKVAGSYLFLSYSHFRRLFREVMQYSPHDFLLNCRFQAAATKLREDKTIQEIASDCGYDDPVVFSRMFKKRLGISPKYYRMALKE